MQTQFLGTPRRHRVSGRRGVRPLRGTAQFRHCGPARRGGAGGPGAGARGGEKLRVYLSGLPHLAPADRKKAGTVYDLPILVGILCAGGQLPAPPADAAFVGELSLSGEVRPVAGMLPMALAARAAGLRTLFVPADSAPEATLAGGMTVYPVEDVQALTAHLRGERPLPPGRPL